MRNTSFISDRTDMSGLLFAGDPHGDFAPANDAATRMKPRALILLGDYEPAAPLDALLKPALGSTCVYWIPGNHDADQEAYYDRVFGSGLAAQNLHGRVVEVDGVRIAGLGGNFSGKVWYPGKAEPRYRTRAQCLAQLGRGNRWRDGLPLKRRANLFPEDFEALGRQRADVLVSHEAPSTHRFGFAVIDELAARMGAQLIVHGHVHADYTATTANGIRVLGVGQATVSDASGQVVARAITAKRA